MAGFNDLETKLNDLFVKKAPALPKGGKDFIVKIAPILSLVLGVLTLLSVLSLWRWAHVTNTYSNFASEVCNAYGDISCDLNASRLNIWLWASLAVLLVEGLLYVLAFAGLQARKKQGWNYIYWAALVSIAYSVLVLFTDYGYIGSFIWGLLSSAVGLWLIFQVREFYLGKKIATEPVERARKRPQAAKK